MKKFNLIFAIVTSLILSSCSGKAQNNPSETGILVEGTNRIEILDFHNEHRCVSCVSIENYIKETLQTQFAKEMESGKITFTLINADDPKNEALVKKYMAYGSTIILNVISDGKETPDDITQFAFLEVENKEKFINEFKAKIANHLTKI